MRDPVLCPNCQSANPDGNRFCGNCGAKLEAVSTPKRRRGDDLPQELIDFDKSIPLIAEPGSDRRSTVPDNIREKAREVFERDRSREAERQREMEASKVARMREVEAERESERQRAREAARLRAAEREQEIEREREAERERDRETERRRQAEAERFAVSVPADENRRVQLPSGFLGLNTVDELEESPVPVTTGPVEPSRVTTRSNGNHFLNLDYEPPQSGGTGVSGPSFLGLSDSLEDVEQDDPVGGHARRNIALVVLLLLIGLGATQWHQIRDQALPFVKNGTQKVMLKVKGKPAQPAADDSSNASNANGTPKIEVAPTNEDLKKAETAANNSTPANAGTTTPPASTSASPTPSTTADSTSTNANPSSTPPTTAGPAANAAATPATTGGTVGAALPAGSDTAKADSTEETSKHAAKDDAKKPAVADASPRKTRKPSGADRPQIADEEPQAGTAELARANAASDPTVQRQLLWQAVKQGNTDASVKLAELYIMGRGVEKSCDQAMVLLRSASAHNSARARGKLGAMYATGECVEQDRVQAYHWMSMALQSNPGSDWTARYRESIWNQMTAGEKMRAGRER